MKFIIIAALVAVAAADSAYPKPSYPAPAYKAATYESYPARPHSFAYDVKDDYSYVNLGHKEESDGKGVSGSYHVTLPDGRVQTVNYRDDGYGLVADVKAPEGGYAKYETYKPKYEAPKYEQPKYEAPKYEEPKYEEPRYEPKYEPKQPAYPARRY